MGSRCMAHWLCGQYKHNSTEISVKAEIALNMDHLNAKAENYARLEGPYSSKPLTVWILVQRKEQAKARATERDIQRIVIYFYAYNPEKVSKVAYRYLKYAMKKCTVYLPHTKFRSNKNKNLRFWLSLTGMIPKVFQKSRLQHDENRINICAQRFWTKLHKVEILLMTAH